MPTKIKEKLDYSLLKLKGKNYGSQIVLSRELKSKIINDCKNVFLDNHPEFIGMKITEHKIMYEITKFYLKGTKYEFY